MYIEMMMRDRNRCAFVFLGYSNETKVTDARNNFLKQIIDLCKELDPT